MIDKSYKLKLYSKKLKSGKCQIKFNVSSTSQHLGWYGYLLVEAGSTLKEVVTTIEDEVKFIEAKDVYYHSHLYNLATKQKRNDSIIIFNN